MKFHFTDNGIDLLLAFHKSFLNFRTWLRFLISIKYYSDYNKTYTLFTTIISILLSLSLDLMPLAPVNSCELDNYYLILRFLFIYSSSGLSTDVFSNKTNINTHNN